MSISFILSNYNLHFAHIFRQQFGENADYPPFLKRASRADCQKRRRGYTPSISRERCKGFAGKQCVDAEALHRRPDKSTGQVQAGRTDTWQAGAAFPLRRKAASA